MGRLDRRSGRRRGPLTGKDWRIQGRAASYGQKIPALAPERARILLDDALSLTFPYRTAEKLTQSGAQGDSLLFDPRPTRFKGNTEASKLKAKYAERAQAFEAKHESLMHELIPLLPESNRDAERAAESVAIARAEKPKSSKKKRRGFGAGGGSGKPFGAG